MRNGSVVGSELVGQPFSDPGYLHPRPSAAGNGYDATHSGGTNLGPSSSRLLHGVVDKESPDNNFDGVEALAAQVRAENHLPADAPVPVDAVTRSASGLDPPHLSGVCRPPGPADCEEAGPRRGGGEAASWTRETESRSLGVLGEPRVNVLRVNMALDASAPGRTGSSEPSRCFHGWRLLIEPRSAYRPLPQMGCGGVPRRSSRPPDARRPESCQEKECACHAARPT